MLPLIGLALLGLTLLMSTLSYVLRTYSRTRLSERLPAAEREEWLTWLDHHDSELPVLTGFSRTLANLGLLVVVTLWWNQGLQTDLVPGSFVVPFVITALLLVLFAVGLPYALSVHAAERALAGSLPLLAGMRIVLWPIAQTAVAIERLVRQLLGKSPDTEEQVSERVEQEILDVVTEGEAQGAVGEEQKDIITSALALQDTPVSSIMTPRTQIDAIHADATFEQVRALILRAGHSRIPVYEDSLDRIIGVLYAKDLLRLKTADAFSARKLMRHAPYVPETKSIHDLLNEFRASRVHIAIVVDEYGGTAGIATIENILEELVGEIDDEYDHVTASLVRRIDDNTLEVDGRVPVDEVNEQLGIALPDEGIYETIGGFVFTALGKVPMPGEEFRHENVEFRIVEAEPRRINRLRIHVAREVEVE